MPSHSTSFLDESITRNLKLLLVTQKFNIYSRIVFRSSEAHAAWIYSFITCASLELLSCML